MNNSIHKKLVDLGTEINNGNVLPRMPLEDLYLDDDDDDHITVLGIVAPEPIWGQQVLDLI